MKKFFSQRFFLALLFILFTFGQANATTILKLDFEQVCKGAELIFEGRVISKETRLSPASGNPFTYFIFEIIDIIKGSYPESTIQLAFMGGEKDGHVMSVRGMRLPEVNERGIFFVESTKNEQVHPLIGWDQGHYLVLSDPSNGEEMVVPVLLDSSAMSVAPTLNHFKQNVREMIRKVQ